MGSRIVFVRVRYSAVPVSGEINQADVFKDLAHCFVGGLFGAAFYSTELYEGEIFRPKTNIRLWIGLTVLEVAAFFIRKA